jgi:hypothetical protein
VSSTSESLGVRIDSNQFDIWMTSLAQYGQCTRAAADIEHMLTWLKDRLIKQDPPNLIPTEQFHDRVIKRQ